MRTLIKKILQEAKKKTSDAVRVKAFKSLLKPVHLDYYSFQHLNGFFEYRNVDMDISIQRHDMYKDKLIIKFHVRGDVSVNGKPTVMDNSEATYIFYKRYWNLMIATLGKGLMMNAYLHIRIGDSTGYSIRCLF